MQNPFEPRPIVIDSSAPKSGRRKSSRLLWIGVASPFILVSMCVVFGVLMTFLDHLGKIQQRQRSIAEQLLMHDASRAVRDLLNHPQVYFDSTMMIEGKLDKSNELKIYGNLKSPALENGAGVFSANFVRKSGTPAGFELRRVTVGGRAKNYVPGEFQPTVADPSE
jgi:hypothetical protein